MLASTLLRTRHAVCARVLGFAMFAVCAGACLVRPVSTVQPETKDVFTDRGAAGIDKVDLLFAIDSSGSMGDKQDLLKEAVPDLIKTLLSPNCIDPSDRSKVFGQVINGQCAEGRPEFPPITDLHVGIVTSSLGSIVDNNCEKLAHGNDHGRLVNRTRSGGTVGEAGTFNFLAYQANKNALSENTGISPLRDLTQLTNAFAGLVDGVGEDGCGFEAQQESWYRFLIQPDPFDHLEMSSGKVVPVGIDEDLLRQRRAFLRPDSLVVIVQVTDENESNIDPLFSGSYGHLILSGAPMSKPTNECAADVTDPNCGSCWEERFASRPECNPKVYPDKDKNNATETRFVNMKQRFGFDPHFPLARYVNGLGIDPLTHAPQSAPKVPNREAEHPNASPYYSSEANCTNPLFAESLPQSGSDELCKRPFGTRSPDQVIFATITGVPHQLLHYSPDDPANILTNDDWKKILGEDPEKGNFNGIDPHMIESMDPRPGLPTEGNTADPIHGRERKNPDGNTLQYACTFELKEPRNCGSDGCGDCNTRSENDPILCTPSGDKQLRAKAYPGVRHLKLARELGNRGVVASICPIDSKDSSPSNKLFGYRPAIQTILQRVGVATTTHCLPRPLEVTSGPPPCLVLRQLAKEGGPEACDDPEHGLSRADAQTVEHYYRDQESLGNKSARKFPVCQLARVDGDCILSKEAGWCYLDGATASKATGGVCRHALGFSANALTIKGTVQLQCLQHL